MSRLMPCDATVSRSRDSPSTVHASSIFSDGRPLQMLFTPNAAHCRRIASLCPCCVPTFIVAFGGGSAPDFAGAIACCAETTVSASAAAGTPALASLTNSRRFIGPPETNRGARGDRRDLFPLRPWRPARFSSLSPPRLARHEVRADDVGVQFDAEAGPVRHLDE